MAAIRHEALAEDAARRRCARRRSGGGFPAERDDLDRNRTVGGGEAVDDFAFVRDDDEPRGGARDNFFAEQRAPASFDEVERAELRSRRRRRW